MAQWTEEQLKVGARHVAYEVVTMNNAAILAERRSDLRERRPLKHRDTYLHIFTDAALVHARNLIEFLCPPTSDRHPDTLLAVHFAANWEPNIATIIGRYVEGDDGLSKQFHRLVAHLSVDRQRYVDKIPPPRWPFIELSDQIQGHYRRFLALLTPERRTWFDEQHANLERLDPAGSRHRRRS